jgi:hypothetical protein
MELVDAATVVLGTPTVLAAPSSGGVCSDAGECAETAVDVRIDSRLVWLGR